MTNTRPPLSSRVALYLGFGSLVALVAISGVDALTVLHQYRMQEERNRQTFLMRNRLLNDIRAQVYLSGTNVRDYLLDSDSSRIAGFAASLAEIRKRMEGDVATYETSMDPAEGSAFTEMKADLSQYWQTIETAMTRKTGSERSKGYAFLRDEIFPRRAATLDLAGRIADLNEQQLNAANQRTSELLGRFRTRLAAGVIFVSALGLGLAIFSTRRILSLESRAHNRLLDAESARNQLAHLSARLVEIQEEERKSVSRELHDEIGQALSAVLIEIRNLQAGLGRWPQEQIHHHMETIKSLVEGAARSVRNMALLLRPSMLDDLGLVPALKWQAREVSRRTSMGVTVEADIQSDSLPEEYKTCIYRIVQEALNNCGRHSQATAVQVNVRQNQEALLLEVHDDGRGFDVGAVKGMGLLGIEERVSQLHGTFEIISSQDRGTLLSCRFPFLAGRQ